MLKSFQVYILPIWETRKNNLFQTCFVAAIGLIFIDFYQEFHNPSKIAFWLADQGQISLAFTYVKESTQLYIWAINSNIGYILIPSIYIFFKGNLRLKNMGMELPSKSSLKLYFLLLIAILIPVFLISYTHEFQNSYPFYRYSDGGKFWWEGFTWEILYALQFVGVEFFFRGFLIHATKKELGQNSIYFSLIPYVMIHFSKPLPECLGSIFAGLILGHLSYKTNSIWGGVFLHVCVAMSMDFLSMYHRGLI